MRARQWYLGRRSYAPRSRNSPGNRRMRARFRGSLLVARDPDRRSPDERVLHVDHVSHGLMPVLDRLDDTPARRATSTPRRTTRCAPGASPPTPARCTPRTVRARARARPSRPSSPRAPSSRGSGRRTRCAPCTRRTSPVVGAMDLQRQVLHAPEQGQTLLVFTAHPGTDSRRRRISTPGSASTGAAGSARDHSLRAQYPTDAVERGFRVAATAPVPGRWSRRAGYPPGPSVRAARASAAGGRSRAASSADPALEAPGSGHPP